MQTCLALLRFTLLHITQYCIFSKTKAKLSASKKITTLLRYLLCYGGLELNPEYLQDMPVERKRALSNKEGQNGGSL